MRVLELVNRIEQQGVQLRVERDRLLISPSSRLTAALRDELRARKPEIIHHLTPPSTSQGDEPDWFDLIGDDERAYLLGEQYKPARCPRCHQRLVHQADCLALDPKGPFGLRFGKHRGKTVWRVPEDYLRWCLEESGLSLTPELREEILRCLHQRGETIRRFEIDGKGVWL